MRLTVVATTVAVLLVGCTTSEDTPAPGQPPVLSGTATTVQYEEANFALIVSNQKGTPPVQLQISIDSKRYVRETFPEGQHLYFGYSLRLPPGDHLLTAAADNGAVHVAEFRLPHKGMRYGVLSYTEGTFAWSFHETRPGFA